MKINLISRNKFKIPEEIAVSLSMSATQFTVNMICF